MRRATTAIIPQLLILLIAKGDVATVWLALLAVILVFLQAIRWHFARESALPPGATPQQAQQAISRVSLLAALNGVWIGVTAMIVLPSLELGWATVVSMIVLGIQAGSVATTAVNPSSYLTFSLPIFLGFSAGWWLVDIDGGLVIPPLYLLFALVLFGAVRNGHATLRSSYDLRVERNLALQQAEDANRQKTTFLATASHDLRQPAAALAFMSEELSAARVDPDLKPVVDAIGRASENINSLIDTLFDLSKLDRALINNDPQWVSLDDLCAGQKMIIESKALAKGLTFKVNNAGGYLFVDPAHIQRWLGNLLDNAVKYTSKGSVNLNIDLTSTGLTVQVQDTGQGIAADQLDNIWGDFYRADQSNAAGSFSMGLGLSIVQRLSELLDIEPKIESVENQGTSVSAEFPLSAYSESAAVTKVRITTGRLALATDKRVLLVEDNADVAEALDRHLKILGFDVDLVADALTARAKLDANIDYALLLTDNRLPDNELGSELCLYANEPPRRLPCLLISADDLGRVVLPARISLRQLQKPLQTNLLRARLTELLADDTDDSPTDQSVNRQRQIT